MFHNDILFSIIMPAYNASSTIGDSIESVLKQTYSNWELIVVNDCSNDNTSEKVVEYSARDKRIKLINKLKNEGVGSARNTGVLNSNSEWIAFLDSDDMWSEDKLEKILELMRKNPNGKLFFTGSAFINYEGKRSNYILQVPQKIDFEELLKQNLISCSSVVVSKESMLKYNMPKGNLHEDYATWLSILKDEPFAYGLNEPLLIYRMSKNSKSGNKLKAVKMNWTTYRTVGVSFFKAVVSMFSYIYRNIKKYSSI